MSRKCAALLVFLCVSLSEVVAQNCILTVPANPLTAAGLATPWLQTGCVQSPIAAGGTATFVQATIVDLDTGNMFTYTPLVLSAAAPNNVAAIPPTLPVIPANSVIGLFGGTNGGSVTLQTVLSKDPVTGNQDSSLIQGNCVNGGGAPYSIFGQFFCCNCREFMDAVYNAIRAGLITSGPQTGYAANQIPILGVDHNKNPCPTTHSFSVVDQDQTDNTPAKYLFVTKTGQLAQSTVTNKAKLTAAKTAFQEFDNGSDEDLVTLILGGIGCVPYVLKDLADPNGKTFFASSLSNEVQALVREGLPRAFVPAMDPMVLNADGNQDINKVNAYRAVVGQAPLVSAGEASTQSYCTNLYAVGAPAIAAWLPMLLNVPAPDFAVGVSNTLAGVLVGRYSVTVNAPANGGMLNCPGLLGKPNPFAKFTGVGAGGPLVCPSPNFNPKTCAFIATNGVTTIAQALGVSNLTPDMTGQTTFDIPLAPATPVTLL